MARITAATREKVRKQLLETAAEHFAERGLAGAQVDGIAVAAGFAKGTVYNYFASKEALFAEVITEGCRAAVQRYAASRHEGSVRECLRALAAADVAVMSEQESFMKVVVREAMSFDPRTYPLIVEHLAPYLEQVQQILTRGVAAGDVRDDRPVSQLTLAFVGVLALLYVQRWGSGGAWPALDEVPDLAVTLFLDGAAARERPRSLGKKTP
jgi:AcrR family transcriptional regulator